MLHVWPTSTVHHVRKKGRFSDAVAYLVQANDIAMLADMSNYMNNDYSTLGTGYGPAQFPHANLQHLFWWSWNANSGDTGVCLFRHLSCI